MFSFILKVYCLSLIACLTESPICLFSKVKVPKNPRNIVNVVIIALNFLVSSSKLMIKLNILEIVKINNKAHIIVTEGGLVVNWYNKSVMVHFLRFVNIIIVFVIFNLNFWIVLIDNFELFWLKVRWLASQIKNSTIDF